MTIIWSLLVCLLGLVTYFITCNSNTPPPSVFQTKSNVVGLHMFWVGLLAFLLQFGNAHVVSILNR